MANVIWGLIVLSFVFWILGLVFKVGGAFIHSLLVIAVVLFIINMVTGR